MCRRRLRVAARRLLRPAGRPNPLQALEERDELDRALALLPARQRAALVVTEVLGFSSEDAARALGVKPATVRALASRARSALRARLGDRDG